MAHGRLIIMITLIVAMMIFAALSVGSCSNRNGGGGPTVVNGNQIERVVIGGQTFDLEVVADAATREKGLSHRASIDEHGGMLFIFPDDQVKLQGFWMINCLVDIDIMYLDRRGKITAMHRMKAEAPKGADETEAAYQARLKRYPSGYPAQFAIELKSGWLDQLNLKVEDTVPLDLERLKALAR